MFREKDFGGVDIDITVPVTNMEDTGYGTKAQSIDVISGVWVNDKLQALVISVLSLEACLLSSGEAAAPILAGRDKSLEFIDIQPDAPHSVALLSGHTVSPFCTEMEGFIGATASVTASPVLTNARPNSASKIITCKTTTTKKGLGPTAAFFLKIAANAQRR